MSDNQTIKAAILDLNNGFPNQGMRCIQHIINDWAKFNKHNVQIDVFDVRQKEQLPGLSYDLYISSGGPGSPLSADENWDKKYMQWIDEVDNYNNSYANYPKKHVFFICHSFQLACRHFKIGDITERKSMSFGVFPMYVTPEGEKEIVFEGMNNPFYAVDSRSYQVTADDEKQITEAGVKLLAIEKERPHRPQYKRALMAIRFNDYFIGTQFHPEADPTGMTIHLNSEEKKQNVIENLGEQKWKDMIHQLNDPEKILWTHDHILPNFLNYAIEQLVES